MIARLLIIALALIAAPAHAQQRDCIGVYRLANGTALDIGPDETNALRWRRIDGTTGALARTSIPNAFTSTLGWTNKPDGHALTLTNCAGGAIAFDGQPGARIPLQVTNTSFIGAGVKLTGRLALPPGDGPAPIIVLVAGSEDTSTLETSHLQRLLPAEGVGVFVYDKRGTGSSGGDYTQDFGLLAQDAVAALTEARRLAGKRLGRIGYLGASLGGWVAPIAALNSKPDFTIVAYGLAISPIEQNRAELILEFQLLGHDRTAITKALEIADAADEIMLSNFDHGFQRFDAARAKYRSEPWYKDIHGNFLYLMMDHDEAWLRANKASFLVGTPWRHDPMPALRASKVPQLWILGHDDLKAPSSETANRITRLAESGKPFTLALIPEAGHGLYQYEGRYPARTNTRLSPSYLPLLRDFARTGRLASPAYGDALIVRPREQ